MFGGRPPLGPAGGAYSASPDPIAALKVLTPLALDARCRRLTSHFRRSKTEHSGSSFLPFEHWTSLSHFLQQPCKNAVDICINCYSALTIVCQHFKFDSSSLQVTFKEQYWGRADMWDVRKLLLGNCIYRGQRVQCFQHQYLVIDELWSDGERVTCGCVVTDTLFAFRSLTSQAVICSLNYNKTVTDSAK